MTAETPAEMIERQAAATNGRIDAGELRAAVVEKLAADISIEEDAVAAAKHKRAERGKKPYNVRTADISKAQPVEWAWRNRIALEYLTLLIGPEGVGKGTLIPWAVARWTKGSLSGAFRRKPIDVAVIADEDDFDRVWTPRLWAAKADLSRVHLIEPSGDEHITLADGRLAEAVEESGAKVVYLDSLMDNLGTTTNDWNAKQLRSALRPAKKLAADLKVAVIGTLHTNKGGETARQMTPGSHQYGAVARGSMFLFKHPDEPERTLVAWEKSNHAKRPNAKSFVIEGYTFEANGEIFTGPVAVDMKDAGEISASQAIAEIAAVEKDSKRVSKAAQCEAMIGDLLARDGKWHSSAPIRKQLTKAGFGKTTIDNAKSKLRIEHGNEPDTMPAVKQWRWPS